MGLLCEFWSVCPLVLAMGCGPSTGDGADGDSEGGATGLVTTMSAEATSSTSAATTGSRPESTGEATTSGSDTMTETEGSCDGCPVPAFAYQIDAFRSGLGGVALADDGGVFVGGWFDGFLTIQGERYDATGTDLLIFRLSPAGEVQWHFTVLEFNPQRVESVAVDSHGRLSVAGMYQGRPDLGGGDLELSGSDRIFLAQYDADGGFRWSRAVGNPFGEVIGVAALSDGSLILAGNADLLPEDTGSVFGKGGGFVTRCDADGVPVWTRYLGVPVTALDTIDDNIVVLGYEFVSGTLVRLDAAGAIVWEADAGATPADGQLAVASDGSVQALAAQSWLRYGIDGKAAATAELPTNALGAAIEITADNAVIIAGSLAGAAEYDGVVLGEANTDAFTFTAAAHAAPDWAAELVGGFFVREFRLAARAGERLALTVTTDEAISVPGHPTPDFRGNSRATVFAYDL